MADRIEKELSRSEFADYLAKMAAAQLQACNQSSNRGKKTEEPENKRQHPEV